MCQYKTRISHHRSDLCIRFFLLWLSDISHFFYLRFSKNICLKATLTNNNYSSLLMWGTMLYWNFDPCYRISRFWSHPLPALLSHSFLPFSIFDAFSYHKWGTYSFFLLADQPSIFLTALKWDFNLLQLNSRECFWDFQWINLLSAIL